MNHPLIVIFYVVAAVILAVPLLTGLLHLALGGTQRKHYTGSAPVRPPYNECCSCCGSPLSPLATFTDGTSLRYQLQCERCGNDEWHDGQRLLWRRPDDSFARAA
jgi:hypothetical protein